MSLAGSIKILGYRFTATPQECQRHLLQLLDGRKITPADIAAVLTMMISTSSTLARGIVRYPGLRPITPRIVSTWTVWNFIYAVKEVAPNSNWGEVLNHLNNAQFFVKDRKGLLLLLGAVRIALGKHGSRFKHLVVEKLYGEWNNLNAQVALLRQIVRHPEVLCLGDFATRRVDLNSLQIPPDRSHVGIQQWFSLDLLETLYKLSSRGLHSEVMQILRQPMNHCPEVLLLGIIQLNSPIKTVTREVFTKLRAVFLERNPNSSAVLYFALEQHGPIRKTLLQVFSKWYLKDSGILDFIKQRVREARDLLKPSQAVHRDLIAPNSGQGQ